jgi:hypothetical protein
VVDEKKLNEALDKGARAELPPNVPPGWLGEDNPDLRKIDEFKPSLNAGIVQESTPETRALVIALLCALFFTSPIAFWMLWRSPTRSMTTKVFGSVVMVGWLLFIVWLYRG